MAEIKPIIRIELDPSNPVQEICQVIMATTPYHPGQEAEILRGVQAAIDQRLKQLEKGDDNRGKPLRESGRKQQDQG